MLHRRYFSKTLATRVAKSHLGYITHMDYTKEDKKFTPKTFYSFDKKL